MPLDFPSSPTNGQVYGNYYYNSARGAWNALLPAATPNFFTNATLNTSTLVDATATASVTSKTPLIVKGLSGQTANLQEWQDSTGNVITQITSGGDFVTNNRATVGATSAFGNTWLSVQSRFAAEVGLVVRGQASQTGNLQEWQNSSGTVLAKVEPSGNISGKGIIAYDYSQSIAGTAATVPSVVRGAASQTADLQQWQSSTGAVLSEINSAGELQVPRIGLGGQPPNSAFFIDATGRAKLRSIGAQSPGIWFTDSSGTESAFLGMGGTSSNDALGIWHNSAWRLQVDTLGRVAMPFQPAFYASGSGTVAVSGTQHDELIPFTIADLNRGNYFNTSTSRFTAPITGVYYFWMQAATTTATSTGPEIYILKNGSPLNTVAISYDSAFYNTFGGSYIISLNANDYVQMSVRNNNGTSFTVEKGRSRFAGYLIG